jgi:hypothetical protein
MPIYEYQCSTCKRKEERFFGSLAEAQEYEKIPQSCRPNPKYGKCIGAMLRVPSAPSFSIGGFSAKNGYSGKTHGEGTGVD